MSRKDYICDLSRFFIKKVLKRVLKTSIYILTFTKKLLGHSVQNEQIMCS